MAALAGYFAKRGTSNIDSTLATTIRAIVGTFYVVLVTTAMRKWPHLKTLNVPAMFWMVLCGVAGVSSWLFEYHAMAIGGPLSKISALDKLSVPMAVILAVVLLKERLGLINWVGVILIIAGAYFVAYKPGHA